MNGGKPGPALAMLASVCEAVEHPAVLAILFRKTLDVKPVLSQPRHENVKRYCKASGGGGALIGKVVDDSARIVY